MPYTADEKLKRLKSHELEIKPGAFSWAQVLNPNSGRRGGTRRDVLEHCHVVYVRFILCMFPQYQPYNIVKLPCSLFPAMSSTVIYSYLLPNL